MKVLVADKLSESFVSMLVDQGLSVDMQPGLKDASLAEQLALLQPEVLVVRSTKVKREHFEASSKLELIVRAGAGVDNIDQTEASARGVFVANCPGKNAIAVAELTIGLLLSLDRYIPDNVIDAREGRWNKARYSNAAGLHGRTMGLVGLGSIGREVARMAQALGMNVRAWSRSLTPKEAGRLGIEYCASPIDVTKDAHAVSVHVAGNSETAKMVDKAFLSAMPNGAFLINTSRSSVVDEDALLAELDAGRLYAGLDVFDGEPSGKDGSFDEPVARHARVYLTHHIGASTEQAQEAIADEAARVVIAYAQTGEVPNCVNLAVKSPATHQLTVRHLDRVGVLASVLEEMRRAEWNVQEMENLVFEDAHAACARIRFIGRAASDVVSKIETMPHVLAVTLIEL
ncbi:MAG: hydroxyacid dehydrogenase [Bacteroidetes bacterium]|nr:hydroxyacid dehydrogenase [Bacteroidota bacterium]